MNALKVLKAMLLLAESLPYASEFTEDLIDEINILINAESDEMTRMSLLFNKDDLEEFLGDNK